MKRRRFFTALGAVVAAPFVGSKLGPFTEASVPIENLERTNAELDAELERLVGKNFRIAIDGAGIFSNGQLIHRQYIQPVFMTTGDTMKITYEVKVWADGTVRAI